MVDPNRFSKLKPLPDKTNILYASDSKLRREVVLKIAPSNDPVLTKEAFALEKLQSKGAVELLDVLDWDGHMCLVLEKLTWPSLAANARGKKKLSATDSLRICSSMANTIAALNKAGYLYRDFYDHHVFYSSSMETKWIDFGNIIGPLGPDGSLENPHHHGFWRTMAPEEFNVGAKLTTAANVYSLGSLFCFVLLGKYPLDPIATTADGLRSYFASGERASRQSPVLFSLKNKRLGKVLDRALKWTPGERYQSVDILIKDMEAV